MDPAPPVDLRLLRAFLAVADTLHFGRAAEELHVAQPALSQQVRRLERELGVQLLTRTSRSVALTPAGSALRDRARALLGQVRRDLDEAVRIGRGEEGRLDVGFVSSALPVGPIRLVQAFRAAHPLVRVELTEGYTSHLLTLLARGALDLAVVRDPDPRDGIVVHVFHREPFVAAVPREHPLATRPSVRATELARDPFVFFPAHAGRLATQRNLAPVVEDGHVPEIAQVGSSWTTLLHLVGAGMGVTVAPLSAASTAPDDVVVLPLEGSSHVSELGWAMREGDERPLLRSFVTAS
ncbi:LysR family transcriptional regulator [Nocardioides bruguierae]|uniref:LysR family transcriptional regulator n=1 Tax=Nocardioides bruguierae TaxID=2945102 RepID=UPI00202073B0|nr:LysR substrate-binding domain-containing protein [Nocardioides bruguierae]MCL8026874.1 LysR substrate-binding domain-containing protein [Nocardioides bruguierae]